MLAVERSRVAPVTNLQRGAELLHPLVEQPLHLLHGEALHREVLGVEARQVLLEVVAGVLVVLVQRAVVVLVLGGILHRRLRLGVSHRGALTATRRLPHGPQAAPRQWFSQGVLEKV